jgi:hypothetical protein
MNWRAARLHGKPTVDFRREHEFEDRADRWLAKAERRLQARRNIRSRATVASSAHHRASKSSDWITVSSTAEVLW